MWNAKPTADDRDRAIVERRKANYDKREGARVGDWVIMPNGEMRRFTHDWRDPVHFPEGGIQTTCVAGDSGSFHLGGLAENLGRREPEIDAYVSYSGSLDGAIPHAELEDTGETKPGRVWIFHHDYATANGGVDFEIAFRVFRVKPGAFADDLAEQMRLMAEIRRKVGG